MNNEKICAFTDLIAWQIGHSLVLQVYAITGSFLKSEIYARTSQMRRCAVSITSNIAEGFSRKSKNEKMQFYYIALGSITELQNQLIIAKDLQYITEDQFSEIIALTVRVH